ncbi:MAG TPA: DUF4382 domain-containing protein [Terriglobales bacterium]|nr:DUF4382 domain-containing protein [Terriglobales bacterium]
MKVPLLIPAISFATALLVIAGCSGGSSMKTQPASSMGIVNLSVSDPATCSAPQGIFSHVYVTITDVRINASSTAGDGDGSWIDLTPSLKNSPQQVDLLGAAGNQCFLAMLGSNMELQPGTYQQIRIILADNSASIANSACITAGANCVVLASDPTPHTLQLSSESKTGIKIPSGQIAGGQFTIAAGQTKDLDLDFNACASIVRQGNGQFRLKPVLHAGEVSTTSVSINGKVVDKATNQPLAGGATLVALEQKDKTGVDRVIMETKTDASGAFVFCPLPSGTYDVVAVGVDGSGKSYAATVILGVSPGTGMGSIPLVAVSAANPAQATITGSLTSANASTPAAGTVADIVLSAEQQVPSGPLVIVPLVQQLASTLSVTTAANAACPANTDCATYNLGVPAANPNVGTFNASGTTYTQVSGSVAYTVEAQAFVPVGAGATDCSPSEISTSSASPSGSLTVTAGATATAATIAFSGCQ